MIEPTGNNSALMVVTPSPSQAPVAWDTADRRRDLTERRVPVYENSRETKPCPGEKGALVDVYA